MIAVLAVGAVAASTTTASAVSAGSVEVQATATPALTQAAIPTATRGKTVKVAFSLTDQDGTSQFKGFKVGDVLTFTAPAGTTITDLMCGPQKAIAKDKKSATCTMPANYFWNTNRTVTLAVDDKAAGGTVAGTMSYSDPQGQQLISADLTIYIAGTVKPGTFCKSVDVDKKAFTNKGRPVICQKDEGGERQRWRYPQ